MPKKKSTIIYFNYSRPVPGGLSQLTGNMLYYVRYLNELIIEHGCMLNKLFPACYIMYSG